MLGGMIIEELLAAKGLVKSCPAKVSRKFINQKIDSTISGIRIRFWGHETTSSRTPSAMT